MGERKLPWPLRIILNLCGFAGLGFTLMGGHPILSGCLMAVGFVYVVWEIAPWTKIQIHKRPVVSLLLFMVIGAGVGAASWWIWRSVVPKAAPLLSATVIWEHPAPITAGTPLSNIQLNAVSPIEGVFTYKPPAGTVLPVGTQSLTATFYASDSAKYMLHTETRSIRIIPAPSSVSPAQFH
jgi:hypothetical protein